MDEVERILSKERGCGSHCGVIMTGKIRYVAHCDCSNCHNISKEK